MIKSTVLFFLVWAGFTSVGYSQAASGAIKSRVDAVVASAYTSAAAEFPCKLKTEGKLKMLRWREVSKCLEAANEQVDWPAVSQQLQSIRMEFRLQSGEILDLAEKSFQSQALPYEKVFAVKEAKALLPLSNTLLKFLPEGALQDIPVFDRSGKQAGTFAGVYQYDRTGGISGTRSPLTLFQYSDPQGNLHGTPERLLLDSYGVSWKEAYSRPGFRLPSFRIVLR